MSIGGLERDEAPGEPMVFEDKRKAAIGLAGGDAEQPAGFVECVDRLDDTVEQRFGIERAVASVQKSMPGQATMSVIRPALAVASPASRSAS